MEQLFAARPEATEDTLPVIDITHDKTEDTKVEEGESASRFAQLRNKILAPFTHHGIPEEGHKLHDQPLISFGLPAFVVPSEVATHFSQASGYFPSTLQRNEKMPLDQEESERFNVLWERRAALERFDTERHATADTKRGQMICEKLAFSRKQEAKRAQLAKEDYTFDTLQPNLAYPVFAFGHSSHINPSKVASHFHRTHRLFADSENVVRSLQEDESQRFAILHQRRESLKEREAVRYAAAQERRMLTILQRKQKLNHASLCRASRLAAFRVRQNSIEANYWGITTEVFPAYVTAMFHRTSALFKDHYLFTLDPSYSLSLEEEEKLRFIPLWDRRMDRRELEEDRNVIALFRREEIINNRVAKLQTADRRRDKHLRRVYHRKALSELGKINNPPDMVNPSEIAAHFPHITKRFGSTYPLYIEQIKHRCEAIPGFDETDAMPLHQEELVRFAPLMLSRQCRAAADHHRCLRADAKRKAILSGIQKKQQIAGKRRERTRNIAMNKKRQKNGLPPILDASQLADSMRSGESEKASSTLKQSASTAIAAIATPMASITKALRNMVTKEADGKTPKKSSTPAASSSRKQTPMKASKSNLSTPSSWLQTLKEAAAHLPLTSSNSKETSSAPTPSRSPSNLNRSLRQATGTRMSFSADPRSHIAYLPQYDTVSAARVPPTEMQLRSKHFYEEAFIPESVRMAVIESHFPNTALAMEKSTGVFNARIQNPILTRQEEEQMRFIRLWKRRSLMVNRDHQRVNEAEGRALALKKEKKDLVKAHNEAWLEKSQAMRAESAIHAAKWAKYDLKMQKEAAARRAIILESRVWQQQQDDKRRKEKHYARCNPSKLKKDAKQKLQKINDNVAKARKARVQLLKNTVERLHKYHEDVKAKGKKALKTREMREKQNTAAVNVSLESGEFADAASTKQILDILDFYDNRFAAIQSEEAKTRKTLINMEGTISSELFKTFAAYREQVGRHIDSRHQKQMAENVRHESLLLSQKATPMMDTKSIEKEETKIRSRTIMGAESATFQQILQNEQLERDIICDDQGNTPSSQASTPQRKLVDNSATLPIVLSDAPMASASAITTAERDFRDNLSPTAEVHPHTTPKSVSSAYSAPACLPSNEDMLREGFPTNSTRAMSTSGLNISTNNASTSITDPNDCSNPIYVSSMSGSFSGSKCTPLNRQSEMMGVGSASDQRYADRSFKQIFSDRKPKKMFYKAEEF